MASNVSDVMVSDPITATPRTPVGTVATLMRDHGIGAMPIVDDGQLTGMLTDRDIVVRCIATGRHPAATFAGDLCTAEPQTVQPDDPIGRAVDLMRQHALRRLPVVQGNQLAGIVTIGDLARAQAPDSPLADISDAPPDH